MGSNQETLKQHILDLSEAKTFEDARKEWDFVSAHIYEDENYCPCGQMIKEVCFLRNRINGEETYVGNVCVKRFMDITFDRNLFIGLKKIHLDNMARPNTAVIDYSMENGFLYSQDEYYFLMSIRRKRILSARRAHWLLLINRRIINKFVVRV